MRFKIQVFFLTCNPYIYLEQIRLTYNKAVLYELPHDMICFTTRLAGDGHVREFFMRHHSNDDIALNF